MASIASDTFYQFASTQTNEQKIIIEATVPTGLEDIAMGEVREVFNIGNDEFTTTQGHIYFSIYIPDYDMVKDLRTIDNVNILLYYGNIKFTGDKDRDLFIIKHLGETVIDMTKGVERWAQLTRYTGNIKPTADEHYVAKVIRTIRRSDLVHPQPEDTDVLKYRVTCTRAQKHSFTSTMAEHVFGGALNDRYNWVVALTDFHVNILLRIVSDYVLVSAKLTTVSMHNRCLIEFGPTSLRPTIAFSMLRLCRIQDGEIVIDPLCGGGSIPIEAAYGYPKSIILCGDNHIMAVKRTKRNIEAIDHTFKMPEVFNWDSTNLPLPDNYADVICSDLPFGKRMNYDVRELYKKLLKEFFRVIKKDTGRVCLLVHKAHNIITNLRGLFYIDRKIFVNVGGLRCHLVMLKPLSYVKT